MHFLSDREYVAFLEAWRDDSVTDIREQYPLNVHRTLIIAGRLGVRHPIDPDTGVVLVQTTDLLLTRGKGEERTYEAWAVKDVSAILDKRTLEKLDIERRYWMSLGIKWTPIVNRGLTTFRARNLKWLFLLESKLRGNVRPSIECTLRLISGVRGHQTGSAGSVCSRLDKQWNTRPGEHVTAFRFALMARMLEGNFDDGDFTDQPLNAFGAL